MYSFQSLMCLIDRIPEYEYAGVFLQTSSTLIIETFKRYLDRNIMFQAVS